MHFDATQRTILDFYAHAAVRNASPHYEKERRPSCECGCAANTTGRSRESRSAVTHRKIKLESFVSCASSPYAFQWAFVYFRSCFRYFLFCVLCLVHFFCPCPPMRTSMYWHRPNQPRLVRCSMKRRFCHVLLTTDTHTRLVCVLAHDRWFFFLPEFSHSVDD